MANSENGNGYNPFALETTTVHAEWWNEGDTVTVRELTYADEQRLASAGINQDMQLPQNAAERRRMQPRVKDLALEHLKILTMETAIVEWTFKMPITFANLKKLARKDGEFIMEAIDRMNPDVDDEFPNDSGDSAIVGEG